MPVRAAIQTAGNPGAVAIVQIVGDNAVEPLRALTGRHEWQSGRLYLVNFADIDTGLACLISDTNAQLMPHGGPRVVQRIIEALIVRGVTIEADIPARQMYPEATSNLEADMLAAVARAASPAAVDQLLAQPQAWQRWFEQREDDRPEPADIIARSDQLDRLVIAPSVVVAGRPNVGKSTLTNRMLGRSASIVADLPGTTRDWVSGMAELTYQSTSPVTDGIAVRWLDTPGLRHSDDVIEQAAIQLANDVVEHADVLIALCDGEIDWPDAAALPREPDVWAVNKVDQRTGLVDTKVSPDMGTHADHPLLISAETGQGVTALQARVIEHLHLHKVTGDAPPTTTNPPWAFSSHLRRALLSGDEHAIEQYIAIQ